MVMSQNVCMAAGTAARMSAMSSSSLAEVLDRAGP